MKGFTQIFRIDYEETFSPVSRFETVHLVLALAALYDWEIKVLDVKTAFLFGELDEEIYMVQPEGFIVKGQESKVCHLQKAIYGFKQAALQWNKLLHKSLVDFSFKRCTSNSGVYVKFIGKDIILIVIYVDNALFLGSNKSQVLSYKKKFMQKWEFRDLGLSLIKPKKEISYPWSNQIHFQSGQAFWSRELQRDIYTSFYWLYTET